jgi:hypothetical protein
VNYTISMVAYILGRHETTVQKYVRFGLFPNAWRDTTIGTPWMIPQGDLEDFRNQWRRVFRRNPPQFADCSCRRCGIILDNGADLCPDCQQEAAGLGCRWYERSVIRSNWGEGRIP